MSENLLSVGGLTLERLRNFSLVANAGGLAKVANGDPARMALLSRQMKELETFFGVALHRRQGRGIALTDAGHRLAVIAREQLGCLDEFKRSCGNLPVQLTIAAGNSILEWLLLPKLGVLQAALPSVEFHFLSLRTADIVAQLLDQTVDLGIVRSDAVEAGLRSAALDRSCSISYALFVPKSLARGLRSDQLRGKISQIPIATSAGGQFREHLEREAAEANWELQVRVSCSSFTQAARAVETGAYAAVLPDMAAVQFPKADVSRFELPFLKGYTRRLTVAYSPRTSSIREIMPQATKALADLLRTPAR